jgi:hypothetical protein
MFSKVSNIKVAILVVYCTMMGVGVSVEGYNAEFKIVACTPRDTQYCWLGIMIDF